MSNADAPGDNYFPLRYVQIAAGIPKKDEQGNIYYEKDESGAVTLDIARVWIETASGDPTTFSLSRKGCVTESADYAAGETYFDLYVRQGHAAWGEVILPQMLKVS